MAQSRSTSALVQVASERGQKFDLTEVELPKLAKNQFYVEVHYAAQNPTDVQSLDANLFGEGSVLGCDFAGTIEGDVDESSGFHSGDSVAGLVWGGEIKGLGAFSKYTIGDEAVTFKIPSSVPHAEAATIPLACCTAWLALFSQQCLNIDREAKTTPTVLIWGGSSSVGLFAIQIAAMYSFNIVTTCSAKNFDLVKSMGATHVFDYKSDDVVEAITKAAPDITYVFDTIGTVTSSELSSHTVQKDGGVLCTVRPGKAKTEKVKPSVKITDVLVWTAFLKDHRYKEHYWPASQEDHDLAAELFDKLPGLLEGGKIKPNPVKLLRGFDSVPEGFDMYRRNEISACKIVYELHTS